MKNTRVLLEFTLFVIGCAFFTSMSLQAQGCDPAIAAAFGGRCPTDAELASARSSSSTSGAMIPINPAFDNAETCTSYDLRTDGSALRSMPMTNQNPLGVCYAHAAVAMIDAWRLENNHEPNARLHQTSELAASIMLRRHSAINPFSAWAPGTSVEVNGGTVCEVVDAVRENGSCNARRVISGERRRSWSVAIRQIGDMLDQFHRSLDGTRGAARGIANFGLTPIVPGFIRDMGASVLAEGAAVYANSDYLEAVSADVIRCLNHTMGMNVINPSNSTSLATMMAAVYYRRTNDIYALMMDGLCTGHTRNMDDLPQCNYTPVTNGVNGYNELSAHLGRSHRIPPTISFCAAFLQHSGGRGSRGFTRGQAIPESCGAHAATIIGRRMNPSTGRCQLLIRNSWGRNCGYYHGNWDCEEGNVWADAEDVMENTFGFQTLQ